MNKLEQNDLILKGYIPLDKSWIIRIGVLDLLNGYDDTVQSLNNQQGLGDDLKALRDASLSWKSGESINVGESATLYRFLRFASWKLGLDKKFILQGTLKNREICDNPQIVNDSLDELLKLDNGTSQWASAAVLLGNKEKIKNPPFKLQLTYEAMKHWQEQRKKGQGWLPRYDETILRQAEMFLKLLKKEKVEFIPQQAEDYCFARAFGFIDQQEGKRRWPNLAGHESNRLEEMEKALSEAKDGKIASKDHRVVQAAAMWQKINNKEVLVEYPEVVNKSWPQFWKFLKDADSIREDMV